MKINKHKLGYELLFNGCRLYFDSYLLDDNNFLVLRANGTLVAELTSDFHKAMEEFLGYRI